MTETTDRKDSEPDSTNSKYCQECGAQINQKAEICPECGVRQATTDKDDSDRSQRAKQFLIAGVVLGLIGILILPIIFAPLAVLCGLLAMFYGRPLAGAGVVAWGVISFFIGFILGVIGLAMLS
jgi:RNA polymerase subunit RPABC4/transcription elongation factor Spt4